MFFRCPSATVQDLKLLKILIRRVKELESYCRPKDKFECKLNVVTFADASKTNEKGKMCMINSLMLGDLATCAVFHGLTWLSKRSKRPVQSVGSAEVLVTSSAAGEGNL